MITDISDEIWMAIVYMLNNFDSDEHGWYDAHSNPQMIIQLIEQQSGVHLFTMAMGNCSQ